MRVSRETTTCFLNAGTSSAAANEVDMTHSRNGRCFGDIVEGSWRNRGIRDFTAEDAVVAEKKKTNRTRDAEEGDSIPRISDSC